LAAQAQAGLKTRLDFFQAGLKTRLYLQCSGGSSDPPVIT